MNQSNVCPAKVILTGEHSVVYGKTALCAAINIYTETSISYNLQDDKIKFIIDGQEDEQTDFFRALKVFTHHTSLLIPNIIITVHSNIPLRSGLGSSASFAVSLVKSLYHFLVGSPIGLDLLVETAVEIESIYHGSTGSGLDVYTCAYGGILKYDKINGVVRMERNFLQNYRLLLIDTGEKKQGGTIAAVQQVARRIQELDLQQPLQGTKIIDEIGDITLYLIDALTQNNYERIQELVSRNQYLLDQLTIVSDKAREIVGICQQYGVSCKITGAGNGGFCLAFLNENDNQQLRDDFQRMGYRTYLAQVVE